MHTTADAYAVLLDREAALLAEVFAADAAALESIGREIAHIDEQRRLLIEYAIQANLESLLAHCRDVEGGS